MTSAVLREQPQARSTAERAYDLLLGGFLYYTFIGLHPLADGTASSRVDGSPIDRFVVLSLFGLALFVLWNNAQRALTCLIGNPGQIALVGFAVLSLFWSDYPDLTLRRALLFVFLTTITLAIVAGVDDLRRFHSFLFIALLLIVVANFAAVALMPSRAISDIGVNGLYGQKNLAGIVAMIAALIGFGWLLGAESARSVALGACALLLIFAFLVLTRSKTSINLTVLGVMMMGFFALAERFGHRFILASISLALLVAAALLLVLAAVDFDFTALLNAVVTDATFTGRDQLWAFAGAEAHKRYWFGHGYGAFWDVGYSNDPILRVETGTWLATTGVGVINQAHNGYLELWLELGLPASIVAGLTTFKGALVGGYRAVFGVGSRQDRAAIGAFAVLLLLQLVHNQTEATLFIRAMAYSSVASLALFAMALPQKRFMSSPQRKTR